MTNTVTKPNVDYTLEVVDELPPKSQGGGGGRSVLEDQLTTIINTSAYHKKHVRIGRYNKGTAATAAKNVLQQRHGRTNVVDGWSFATRRLTEGLAPDAQAEVGLFAKYDPEVMIPGAKELHDKAEVERKRKLEVARQERIAGGDEGALEPDEEEEDEEYEDEEEEGAE